MNLMHVEYLRVLAEEQSFSRAAEKLFISQPALTKALQSVENELGLHLFIREKRRAYPTPAGLVFLEYAKKIHRMQEHCRKEIQTGHSGREKKSRFGINRLMALDRYSECIGQFTREYPGESPDFFIIDSLRALEELKAHRIDVAVVLSEDGNKLRQDFDAVELGEESLAVVIPEDEKYQAVLEAGKTTGSIPVKMLDGLPAVSTARLGNFNRLVNSYLEQHGVYPDYKYEFSNQFMAINAAETNLAICFTHRVLVKGDLEKRTFLLTPGFSYHHYFCTRKSEPMSVQAQRYLEMLLNQKENR